MKKDYTHLCIVLDASGSMASIENDIKGSFNALLAEQKKFPGKTAFDLFQFSGNVTHLVKSADLSKFDEDLMAKYYCSGCTALNDAVCTAIDTMGRNFSAMAEEERPEHVLCVIITDGFENASKEFTSADVKKRIEHQRDEYKWEFRFIAADQDAWETGSQMGLLEKHCITFERSADGVEDMACCICHNLADIRLFGHSINHIPEEKNSGKDPAKKDSIFSKVKSLFSKESK